MRISDWSSDVCSSDLVRVLVELMAPVPSQALRAEVGAVEGGRRVVRQTVELRAGDRPVARAHGLRMRRDDLELPARATEHRVAFDPDARPDLTEPNRAAVQAGGRARCDSVALETRGEAPTSAKRRVGKPGV